MIVTLPDRQLLEALTSHTPADQLGVELRIWDWNSPVRDVLGDEAVVVVLDQGAANTVTLFHTQAPIGDSARKEMVKKSLDSLSRS